MTNIDIKNAAAYCAIDTETTGLDPITSEIIQFAGVILDAKFRVLKEINLYAHPTPSMLTEASIKAFAVNGYAPELWEAKGAGTQEELLAGLVSFFAGCPEKLTAIGHNVAFDIAMVSATLERGNIENTHKLFDRHSLDTISVAFFCDICQFGKRGYSYRLSDLCRKHGIKQEQAHDAQSDIHASLALLEKFVAFVRAPTAKIHPSVTRTVPTKFVIRGQKGRGKAWHFSRGKYIGIPIKQIATTDPNYLRWVTKEVSGLTEEEKEYIYKVLSPKRPRGRPRKTPTTPKTT